MKIRKGLAPRQMTAREAKGSDYLYYESAEGIFRYCSTAIRVESESGLREIRRLRNTPWYRRVMAEGKIETNQRIIAKAEAELIAARAELEEAARAEREAEEAMRRFVEQSRSV